MKTLIKTRILDRIDLSILDVLQRNGRISNVNLAKQVNLSPSPCLERVKKTRRRRLYRGLQCQAKCH
jgi:Lrp/AsnC family leucine-responsive transcriptional regulator